MPVFRLEEEVLRLDEALAGPLGGRPNTDDEPTLDAPAPSPDLIAAFSAPTPVPAGVAARAPALGDAEDCRRAEAITVRLPERTTESYVVAGLWAVALSLIAALVFMATSA